MEPNPNSAFGNKQSQSNQHDPSPKLVDGKVIGTGGGPSQTKDKNKNIEDTIKGHWDECIDGEFFYQEDVKLEILGPKTEKNLIKISDVKCEKDLQIFGTKNSVITATDFKKVGTKYICLAEAIWYGKDGSRQRQFSTAFLRATKEGHPFIIGSGTAMSKDGTWENKQWQQPDLVKFYQGFNSCPASQYKTPEQRADFDGNVWYVHKNKVGDSEIHPNAYNGVDICFHSPKILGDVKIKHDYQLQVGYVMPQFLTHQITVKSTPAFIMGYDAEFRQVNIEGYLGEVQHVGHVIYVTFNSNSGNLIGTDILGLKGSNILINNKQIVDKLKQAQKKDKEGLKTTGGTQIDIYAEIDWSHISMISVGTVVGVGTKGFNDDQECLIGIMRNEAFIQGMLEYENAIDKLNPVIENEAGQEGAQIGKQATFHYA